MAIEDYMAVRPTSKKEQLFLNIYAPYDAVSTSSLRKYINISKIKVENRKCGPHVLRSSLANSMVNNDIPYETVKKVLGHTSSNAIKHYVRIDIENLKKYSLNSPISTEKFRDFLYGEEN